MRKALRKSLDTRTVDILSTAEHFTHGRLPADTETASIVMVKEPVSWFSSYKRFRNDRRRAKGMRPIMEYEADEARAKVESWSFKVDRWRERCQAGEGVLVPFPLVCVDGPSTVVAVADRLSSPLHEKDGWWPERRVTYKGGGRITDELFDGQEYLDEEHAANITEDEALGITAAIENGPAGHVVDALGLLLPDWVDG